MLKVIYIFTGYKRQVHDLIRNNIYYIIYYFKIGARNNYCFVVRHVRTVLRYGVYMVWWYYISYAHCLHFTRTFVRNATIYRFSQTCVQCTRTRPQHDCNIYYTKVLIRKWCSSSFSSDNNVNIVITLQLTREVLLDVQFNYWNDAQQYYITLRSVIGTIWLVDLILG
jgi:hypothetical protein